MKRLATIAASTVFALTCLVGYVIARYIPFEMALAGIVIGLVMSGALGASVVWLIISRLPDSRRAVATTAGILVTLLLVPAASMFYPGRITASRFGLTVYGLIPVPFLDITVNRYGLLWFRVKTHLITVEEVAALVDPSVEEVVVGIGWDRVATVEPGVRELAGGHVAVLSTPDAFALYNRLRSEGRTVILVAHSTC